MSTTKKESDRLEALDPNTPAKSLLSLASNFPVEVFSNPSFEICCLADLEFAKQFYRKASYAFDMTYSKDEAQMVESEIQGSVDPRETFISLVNQTNEALDWFLEKPEVFAYQGIVTTILNTKKEVEKSPIPPKEAKPRSELLSSLGVESSMVPWFAEITTGLEDKYDPNLEYFDLHHKTLETIFGAHDDHFIPKEETWKVVGLLLGIFQVPNKTFERQVAVVSILPWFVGDGFDRDYLKVVAAKYTLGEEYQPLVQFMLSYQKEARKD